LRKAAEDSGLLNADGTPKTEDNGETQFLRRKRGREFLHDFARVKQGVAELDSEVLCSTLSGLVGCSLLTTRALLSSCQWALLCEEMSRSPKIALASGVDLK